MKTPVSLLALGSIALLTPTLHADPINPFGTASSFAVLGASTVTNTGSSVLSGDVGVAAGTAIVGFPPAIVNNGAIHDDDAVAIQAQVDALTGYNSLAGMATTDILTGQDLGGLTLDAGVYSFSSSAQLTGNLTIDFQGINDADIVFQIGTTLTTASASGVNIINPGLNDNIFWQVGSSATLGTTTAFMGTIVADQSVTLNTGATINCGSAIALVGAVTLDDNTIGTCPVINENSGGDPGGGDTNGANSPSPVPEPGSILLVATGLAGAAGALRRKFHAGR